jgi:hypothetical protein
MLYGWAGSDNVTGFVSSSRISSPLRAAQNMYCCGVTPCSFGGKTSQKRAAFMQDLKSSRKQIYARTLFRSLNGV